MALALLQPWIFMSISVYYLLTTILKLLVTLDFRTLFSRRALNDAWFGAFWVFMGPQARQGAIAWVEALLHGRIKDGRITTKPSMPPIHGVILEIGAGSGMWTSVLADVAHAPGGAIRKIYGVEPNPISAAALKKRAADVGLGATYEVIPAGIEDLQKEASIEPGSIDCIMTVHCLCSIPEPEKNIRLLYNYLKEGGRWYVYEHVRCEKGTLVPLIQSK